MPLEADLLIDRRRLKRWLLLWRTLAIVLVVGGVAGFAASRLDGGRLMGSGLMGSGLAGGHVARLAVRGFIAEDRRLERTLDGVARDGSVRALIVAIDSPGGSVGGGEALLAALQRVAERKPVVAVLGGTAASAGYMTALGAERVWAREGTVTGSIGVLLQSVDASQALARLGVNAETIASGPLKDQPSPFRPLTPEGREALLRVVTDLHDQFVARVVVARRLPEAAVRGVADGRVLTGRQALSAGLVDAIGGEREARAWLAAERGIPDSLPVRELEPRGAAERLLSAGVDTFWKTLVSEWLGVDRLRMLWQSPVAF